MRNFNKNFLIAILLIFPAIVIFLPYLLKNLYPFPGNFLIAWFEPWKSDNFLNGTINIPHKPIADDIFRQIYPFKILATDIIKNLKFPLWNPYNGSGMPLLATMHVGFLNPFNFLFFIFPDYLAWTFYIVLQPIFIGLFTYLYSRTLGITKKGSIFSAFTLVFSGFVIIRTIFGDYDYALISIPLSFYLIESYLKDPYTKLIYILPFAILLTIFSTQPQIIFYILSFISIYIIYRYFQLKKISLNFKKVIFLYLLILIGIGLGSIQLIPTYELYKVSNISSLSSRFIFERFLLPVEHLITILIPNYFGNMSTYNYWGSSDYIETIAVIGITPCFVAYLCLGKINNKIDLRKFYFLSIIITIALTLNWILPKVIYSLPIPVISTGVPSRIFLLTTFSIAILSGYGFDKLQNAGKLSKAQIYKTLPFTSVIILLLLLTFIFYKLNISCNNEFVKNCRSIAFRNTIFETSFFAVFILLYSFQAFFKKQSFKKTFPILVIILILIPGIYNANKFLPFSSKETFLPEHELIKTIKNTSGNDRVFGLESANINTDFATYYRFYNPNYYDPLYIKNYGELIAYANSGTIKNILPRSDVEITNDLKLDKEKESRRNRLLNLLGVKYLIIKKPEDPNNINGKIWENKIWYIKQNENVLPRTYLVNDFEVISDKEKHLERIFNNNFDIKTKAVLFNYPLKLKKPKADQNDKVIIQKYKEDVVLIQTDSVSERLLVLSDNYYPGWKAFIDNKEVPIYKTNYTFRGIMIPPGKHAVRFLYDPGSFKLGFYVSLIFVFLYFMIIIFRPKESRNKNHR